MISCKNYGKNTDDQFGQLTKQMETGKNAYYTLVDYRLTRYACYLIAQNGDPSKSEIALAQTYFATQTHKQEVSELLIEDEKRVQRRGEITGLNRALAEAAD